MTMERTVFEAETKSVTLRLRPMRPHCPGSLSLAFARPTRKNRLNHGTRSGTNHHVAGFPTILVFDSGLGGLTVLREIVAARPDAHYVYVADDAFFPYGHHSEAQLVARVVPVLRELISTHAPDLVVIASNTASTLVLSHLRAAYKTPFVGTVPAIKPACARSRTKRVSVLGTL